MTERAPAASESALAESALAAWRTVRGYQDPERYRDVAGAGHAGALAQAPAVLGRPPENGDGHAAAYLAHSCDLTVSGGAATALAAPLAACALAEHYVLRRVAGAGAAALTATAVAAAEFARSSGADRAEPADASGHAGELPAVRPGYAGIARLTGWLAGDHDDPAGEPADRRRLARLLPPSAELAAAHRLVVAATRPHRSAARRWAAVALAASALPRGPAAVAAACVWVGAAVAWLGLTVALLRSPDVAGWVVALLTPALLVTVVLAGLAATAIAAAVRARELLDGAADASFGLVPGVPTPQGAPPAPGPNALDRLAGVADPAGLPPITTWFTDAVDDVAGLPAGDDARHALTFGDLWLGRVATDADADQLRRAAADADERVVDLRLVATDVTRGRPVTLPFGVDGSTPWLVCPDCWLAVLPARIVDQVLAASPTPTDHVCPRHGTHLRPLPPAGQLPVAVAARMAAGVPGLLRAVPLHRALPATGTDLRDTYGGWVGRADATPGAPTVTTHWFVGSPPADAPATTFDAALPRWPTVALSVVPDRARADELDGAWVEAPDADAAPPPAPPAAPADGLAFARAVLGAPNGWRDRVAAERPGSRNRIGIVRRGAGAGLFPTDDEVLRLAVRGHHAGRELRARFTGRDGEIETQTGADRYRWMRIRATLHDWRRDSLCVAAGLPLLTDVSGSYRVPAAVAAWFTPPIAPGRVDPAWADATAALTHLRTLTAEGVLDWDTDYGAPPADPDGPA